MTSERIEIIIAGIGGQGVIYSADLIAKAALSKYGFVSMIAHYGPESRGSVTSAEVVISNAKSEVNLDYPIVESPDIFIAMHQKGFEHHMVNRKTDITRLKYIIYDSTLVSIPKDKDLRKIELFAIPATQLAKDELKNIKMANIILTAAIAKAANFLSRADLEKAITDMSAINDSAFNLKAIALRCNL